MKTPPQSERKKLETWWAETNGTGTDACSTCRPSHICAWHRARLDELADLILAEKAKARHKDGEDFKNRLEMAILEARIDALNLLHRWDGRDYDNATDEKIDELVKRLQSQLAASGSRTSELGQDHSDNK
jgi:hypothetical protein